MGMVVLTSQGAVRQNVPSEEQAIQGLTIEKQPYAEDHDLPDLIVTSVKSSGMTHDTGVEVGDVIEAVGGQPVVSTAQRPASRVSRQTIPPTAQGSPQPLAALPHDPRFAP